MASNKDFLDYVLDRLQGLEEISWRAMMGEYLIYYRGKIVGGVYDNRLLVKPTESVLKRMPTASHETPYPGARAMLAVDCLDDGDALKALFQAIWPELPAPKR